MALTHFQQAFELLDTSRSPLLVSPTAPSIDTVTSLTALGIALKRAFKKEPVRAPFAQLPYGIEFLRPHIESLPSSPIEGGDFILTINTRKNKIKELRYEKTDETLRIFLSPESELPLQSDVTYQRGGGLHDLVVSCGADDLEALGEIFEKQPQFFFDTPILNIDHKPTNEQFGEVNLIDITSSSTSEIVALFLDHIDQKLIDSDLANILLTGIISATENFRNHLTRPRTLTLAASLMSRGADHETIIKYLYKTKPIELLKLLGRTLDVFRPIGANMGWAYLESDASAQIPIKESLIPLVVNEMREYFPHLKCILIVWDDGSSPEESALRAVAWSAHGEIAERIKTAWRGDMREGNIRMEHLPIPKKLLEKEISKLLTPTEFMLQ